MKYVELSPTTMMAVEGKAYLEVTYTGEIVDQSKDALPLSEAFPADKIQEAVDYIKTQHPVKYAKYNVENKEARAQKEREYDLMYNEGGEGYNPYREGSRPTYWKSRR